MRIRYLRESVAAIWLMMLGAIGFVTVASASGWISLAVLAVISLVMLRRLWREPATSMSESIRQAQR